MDELEENEILASKQYVKTVPIEYARHIKRVLDTGMTKEELAQRINQSVQFIDEYLNLIKESK